MTLTLLRFLTLVLLGTTFGVFLTRSLYRAFRRGIVSNRSSTFRRNKEPLKYWFTIAAQVFFLLFFVIAMFRLAFGIALRLVALTK